MADLTPTLQTLSQLAGFGDSYVKPGDRVYIVGIDQYFVYRNPGTLPTIDGSNVVKSIFLPGFWTRAGTGTTSAMNQAVWIIDPVNGNDANDGLAQSTALKTDAERQRRMGPWPTWTLEEYHLRYLNDVPSTDPVNIVGNFDSTSGNIYVHGSMVNGSGKTPVLASLAVDAVVTVNHATNTPLQITANGLSVSWTADGLLNTRCRFTSGANVGGVVWPMAEPGAAKTARMNEAQLPQTLANPLAFQTGTFNPVLNDTFVVESLVAIGALVLNMASVSNGVANTVVLDSLKIDKFSQAGSAGVYGFGCDYASTTGSTTSQEARFTSFVGTKFRAGSEFLCLSTVTLANCYADDSASGLVAIMGGVNSSLIRFMTHQRLGCLIQGYSDGPSFQFHKYWNLQNGIGIFGNTGGPGVELYGASLNASTGEVWGVCGAGGTPFLLRSGSSLVYRALPPGPAAYYFIDVTAAPGGAWISYVRGQAVLTTAPAFDPATSTFTTYRALTPAVLQNTNLGTGGLNGQWFDPPSGCFMAAI